MTERFHQFMEYPLWVFACIGLSVGFGVPMTAYVFLRFLGVVT